jgi:hypothetical protein
VTTDSPSTTVSTDEAAGPSVTRYRCAACGNLTRFNVVTSRRTKAFHHYSVGGDLAVEDVEILDETVEDVSCRWCGNGNSVEVLEDGATGAG